MRARPTTNAVVLAALLGGCLSVNVYVSFPPEKLESAASNIEDLVGSGASTPHKAPPPAPKPEGRAPAADQHGLGWLLPAPAEAQEVPELKTRTPEVMAAIESRRKRLPELSAAAAAGCIGENKQGLVESRSGERCPPTIAQLVGAENGDRMFIYKTLVEQNSMAPGDITKVQAAFAKVRRDKAAPGTWIQQETGQWVHK